MRLNSLIVHLCKEAPDFSNEISEQMRIITKSRFDTDFPVRTSPSVNKWLVIFLFICSIKYLCLWNIFKFIQFDVPIFIKYNRSMTISFNPDIFIHYSIRKYQSCNLEDWFKPSDEK